MATQPEDVHVLPDDARPDPGPGQAGSLAGLLQDLVDRTGAELGVVLGSDGLYRARSNGLGQVAAERSAAALYGIWSMSDSAGQRAGRGTVETITVRCSEGVLVLAPITSEAAVTLVLGPKVPLAEAGYAIVGFTEHAAAHIAAAGSPTPLVEVA